MADLDRLQDLIRSKCRDAEGALQDADYLAALTEALKTYSRHRPRHVVADLPGTDSADLALPAEWIEGSSTVVSIEYPVGLIPEELLDARDYRLYRSPVGLQLRLLTVTPTTADVVRMLYTTLHSESTLPIGDEEAVANLAAGVCLRQLAARYGQTIDPLIGADVVNYRSKADEFRRLAQAYEDAANAHLGIGVKNDAAAASVTAAAADTDRVRLTHWRR